MKNHEVEIRNGFAIFGLKNVLVNVELKCVVPVVRVWEMFDGGVGCEFVDAAGFCDFAAAFPVVDKESWGVRLPPLTAEFIYHID